MDTQSKRYKRPLTKRVSVSIVICLLLISVFFCILLFSAFMLMSLSHAEDKHVNVNEKYSSIRVTTEEEKTFSNKEHTYMYKQGLPEKLVFRLVREGPISSGGLSNGCTYLGTKKQRPT